MWGIDMVNQNLNQNNMPYYRIRIDELKNGETRYVPQEGFLVEYVVCWIKRQDINWQDMSNMHEGGGFKLESDALEMINYVRGYREKKEGEQVKSVTYKNI
jgi:hypothetical protein